MNKQLRQQVYNKYNKHCAYCGEEIQYKDMQIDHIIPQYNYKQFVTNQTYIPDFLKHLTVEDIDHIDNLNPACRVCNKWKSAHHLELFRSEIEAQVERLNKRSSNYRMAKKYGLIQEIPQKIVFYFEKVDKDDSKPEWRHIPGNPPLDVMRRLYERYGVGGKEYFENCRRQMGGEI